MKTKIPSYEEYKKRREQQRRERINAICPHCGQDVLEEVEYWASDEGIREKIEFWCECGEKIAFHIGWKIEIWKARPITNCVDCGAEIPPDGACWYCENDPSVTQHESRNTNHE